MLRILCRSDVLNRIKDRLHKHAESAKMSFRAASLWVEYMGKVDVLRTYSMARAHWTLCVTLANHPEHNFPYLAASGHNLYTTSASVYQQHMVNLKKEHTDIHQHFDDGLHEIRRSDRPWAGLSSDLIIEQVLMRSMKTSGELTRRRGSNSVRCGCCECQPLLK